MSEYKHTPGPWIAVKNDYQEWRIDAPDGDPNIGKSVWRGMVTVYECDDYRAEGKKVAKANARLIAAAPEMLEALVLCRKWMYDHASNTDDQAFDKLCEAIEKATGKKK